MGEAKRKKQRRERVAWPQADDYRGTIDLHMLPPVAAINGARIRQLTGDGSIPDALQIILPARKRSGPWLEAERFMLAFALAVRWGSARSVSP